MKGHSAAAAAPRHRGHNDVVHRPCTAKGTQPNFQLPFGQEKVTALDLHSWQHGKVTGTARSRQPHQLQIARTQPRATPHPAASHQADSSHTWSSLSAPQIQIPRVTTSLIRAGAQRTPPHPRGRSCPGPLLAQPLLAELAAPGPSCSSHAAAIRSTPAPPGSQARAP